MALIRCTECRAKVSDKAAACPKCGAPVERPKKKQISTGCGCLIMTLVTAGIISAFVSSDQNRQRRPAPKPSSRPPTSLPNHTVISTEDVSYANVARKSYRVRVSRELTRNELQAISTKIITEATSREKINAIAIYFFLPGSDPSGAFTAGKATWAPAGDWSKAATDLAPKLVIQAGSAMGSVSKDAIVALPLVRKQEVFRQIVRYQDQGMDGNQSYTAAAKRFNITVEQARNISTEGVVKGWPMP